MTRPRMRPEEGSASVLGVQVLAMLAVVTLVAAGVAALVVTHRRAQAAADLAALAGATAVQQGHAACVAAAGVATGNHARLTRCAVDGDEVRVEVAVASARLPGGRRTMRAEARAGPVDTAAAPSSAR